MCCNFLSSAFDDRTRIFVTIDGMFLLILFQCIVIFILSIKDIFLLISAPVLPHLSLLGGGYFYFPTLYIRFNISNVSAGFGQRIFFY